MRRMHGRRRRRRRNVHGMRLWQNTFRQRAHRLRHIHSQTGSVCVRACARVCVCRAVPDSGQCARSSKRSNAARGVSIAHNDVVGDNDVSAVP